MLPDTFTQFERPKLEYEPGGGKVLVEKGSHVPVMVQVRAMIAAGERLGEYRQGKHDFEPGELIPDDVVPDPTRSPNFDLADATQAAFAAERMVENVKHELAGKVTEPTEVKPDEASEA